MSLPLESIPVAHGGAFVPALEAALTPHADWLARLAGLGAAARPPLLGALARRWLALGRGGLAALVAPGQPVPPDVWTRALAVYPVLARLVERTADEWRRQCGLLVERAARDGVALESLAILGSPGALPPAAIAVGETIYKPRDQRAGAWFLDLCRALNDAGLSAPLHERRLRLGDGYGWDERVVAAPCPDDAVERFFVRAGALLRVLELVRATDMHRLNVVAAGEHLAVVDFDGLLAPVVPERSPLANTALATGLLPIWVVGDPGQPALCGGGLHRGGRERVPIPTPVFAADGVSLVADYREDDLPPTAPASPYAWRAAILAGYQEVDALLGRAPGLAARMEAAAPLPVRYFPRPSNDHHLILLESLAPACLRSPWARERVLQERLAGPLADAERAALRDGFMPIFFALPGDDAVLLPDGGRRAGAFAARALDRLAWRVDAARERDVIVTALAVGERPEPAPPELAAPAPTLDWGAAAAAIAGEVVDAGLAVGVLWEPGAGVRRLGGLPADLLSGGAGIAAALATVAARTGEGRFREAALRALEPTVQAIIHEALPGRGYGAYLGLAGQLYAIATCARLLDEAALAALVTARIAALAGEAAALHAAPVDVGGGIAGLLLVCPEPWLGDLVLDRWRAGDAPAPWLPGGWPAFVPGLDEGVAAALRRVADRSGDPKYAVEAPARARAAAAPLDALEDALDAGRVDEAREHAAAIAGRKQASGSWLPEALVADRLNPSATTGLLAVAMAFLRLAAPGEIPSLRRLEPIRF